MAEKERVSGPTRVSKGEYNPTQKMTPEQAKTIEEGGKATRAEQLKKRASKVYRQRSQQAPTVVTGQQARPKQDVRLRVSKERQGVGGKAQLTPSQMKGREFGGKNASRQQTMARRERTPVDVKTGKPKPTKTYGERMIGAIERFGAKVAPPGSVTRLRETGARAPRTMDERLGSISRTASKTFPGKATRPGGILDIPALAARGKGPALKAQKGTQAATKRRAAMSLAEKKRKGLRVTGADVPSAVPEAERVVSAGVGGIKRTEGATEGHLGKFVGRGPKAPVKVAKVTPAKRRPTKKKPKVPWYMRALEGARKLSAEATRESQKYEAKTAGKKKTVKKVQKKLESLPPTPKRK